MAGGKITRIVGGKSTTIVEEDFTGYYKNLTMNAGGKNIFTAQQTHFGTPKEPEKKDGYFVKGWWTNHKDEKIKRAVYGQRLRFHIQMNRERVNVGDIVKFGLYDSDMRSFGTDDIKADDPILLVHTETEKPYTDEVVNAEYKVIIEFTAGYNSLANALIKDKDGIYELYFRCLYVNKGKESQHIELPLSFGDYLNLGSIVIDRYKMPGLNPEGTGIAEDMAYGMGKPYKGKLLYDKSYVEQYIKEYTQSGFIEKHLDFANEEPIIPEKEIEEVVIVNKSKKKKNRIVYPQEPKFYVSEEDLKRNQERTKEQNKKAIYSREECYNIKFDWKEYLPFIGETTIKENYQSGKDIKDFNERVSPITKRWRDDEYLFWNFENTAELYFAKNELQKNLERMIAKFKRNEGGIYEDNILTQKVAHHSNTIDYCNSVEDYMAEQLKIKFSELENIEDKEPYFLVAKNFENATKKLRDVVSGKNIFDRPKYSYTDGLWEATKGLTIALNDIWATEVILKELNFTNNESYIAKYEVTLWDHFGLNLSDIQKRFVAYPSIKEAFICWFILQHLRGYKPFLTKITFEKEFNGHLNIGRKEREQQREIDRQQRIDKLVEEEKQKDARRPKF